MKLAKGSDSWILFSIILCIISSILAFLLYNYDASFVFLLIGIIFFLITVFFIIFFRDPERKKGEGIVAAADGKIREISEINDKDVGKCYLVSTFMNIYNVHVNRAPFDGTILSVIHKPGAHTPAFKKESEKNERVEILLKSSIGKIKIIQIAGTIARRIIPYISKSDKINKGERIGLIRLGSRVDLYIPKKAVKKINVKIKDIVFAGESSIGKIND